MLRSYLARCLQVVRLSGAGHNIRREQFDGFVDAIRQFFTTAYARAAQVGARSVSPEACPSA